MAIVSAHLKQLVMTYLD